MELAILGVTVHKLQLRLRFVGRLQVNMILVVSYMFFFFAGGLFFTHGNVVFPGHMAYTKGGIKAQ